MSIRASISLVVSATLLYAAPAVFAQQDAAAEGAPPAEARQAPASDDTRAQYPGFLANSFVSLNVGYIDYPFSALQLEPGFQVESIEAPHVAARAALFGRRFGRYFSGQVSYMRPVKYVRYQNINGVETSRTVWMHFGTATLQTHLPIGSRLSVFGEGGLAITNRSGFEIGDASVVRNEHFASPLFGAGFEYRVNRSLDVVYGGTYIRPSDEHRQPHTLFVSAGIRYNLRPLPAERVKETQDAGRIVPENLIQVGYATDALGYGANNVLSKEVPIFWRGKAEVEHSLVNVQYHRNVFYTKRVFALDFGVSYAQWKSKLNKESFHTLSVFPVMRFTLLRSKPADLYVLYSVAGPSYISRTVIDDLDTGSHFTFQDFMGVGVFIGERRQINAEINLNHYSNGNIQTENAGVKVPLTFKLGYGF